MLDVGSGPGRFLPHVGGPGCRRVALDLSEEMLRRVARDRSRRPDLVRGDALRPPFPAHVFHEVAVLGNPVGFAGPQGDRLWREVGELLEAGGRLILEVVAGPGERSAYLARLPPTSLPRLLHAPLRALLTRVDREGFLSEAPRKADPGAFRRYDPGALARALMADGWVVNETLAVAPALGADPARLEAVEADAAAWGRLRELEELLGRRVERLQSAAAVLLAATAP